MNTPGSPAKTYEAMTKVHLNYTDIVCVCICVVTTENREISEMRLLEPDREMVKPGHGLSLQRPCRRCDRQCRICGANDCTCECSVECADASKALSSEPEQYPIEPQVLALVYEMSRIRGISPCWSCEGHLDHEGQLWRTPQVWFYAASRFYVQQLETYATHLNRQSLISNRWYVTRLDCGHTDVPMYCLQPHLDAETRPSLHRLQKDMQQLARDVVATMTTLSYPQTGQL